MRGAVEFQVSSRGIAYRHPEDGIDENGDDDGVDIVMEFWDWDPAATEPLIETQRSAILCKFTGCDPFFEPYSVRGPYLSFVTIEVGDENDSNDNIGVECLPGAVPGECDVTADADNDDFAVVVFSLEAQQAQIFPVAPQLAALITTTPLANADGTVNINGALCGDADADGTLNCDGIENEQFKNIDNCPGVPNKDQVDGEGDGLGAQCDKVVGDDNQGDVAGFRTCDLDNPADGVDADDIGQIFADRGTAGGDFDFATGEFLDSRNNDRDSLVTVLDARQCSVLCETNPEQDPINCQQAASVSWTPPAPATFETGNGGCGLLGIEAVLVLFLARRRGSRKGRAWGVRI